VSLTGADELDLIYVHPAVAGQGIGAMLCDAVERLAAGRGAPRLVVDASDSARGFFERRGYVAQQRNTVFMGDEWFANTTMEKKLTPKGSTPKGSPS
jgi:putative acetyltransferase